MRRILSLVVATAAAWTVGCSEDPSAGRPDESADTGGGPGPRATDEGGGDAADAGGQPAPIGAVVYSIFPGTGPTGGGTVAAIAGAGFQDGIRVFFGESEAQAVHFLDGGRLSVVAPAGVAGLVDVRFENPDAGTATLPAGFLYWEPGGSSALGPKLLEALPAKGPSKGAQCLLCAGTTSSRGCSSSSAGRWSQGQSGCPARASPS